MNELRGLQRWLRPYAEELIRHFPQLKVTSVFRSTTKQWELWNRRASNPYPVAYPGTSWHEYGRAWDMVGPPDVLSQAGVTWESWGGTWGGRFSNADPIHFQA